jgi:hypothetical protein
MEQVLKIIFLFLTELAKLTDKLRKGEIDPSKVDVKDWNAKLKALQKLTKD